MLFTLILSYAHEINMLTKINICMLDLAAFGFFVC